MKTVTLRILVVAGLLGLFACMPDTGENDAELILEDTQSATAELFIPELDPAEARNAGSQLPQHFSAAHAPERFQPAPAPEGLEQPEEQRLPDLELPAAADPDQDPCGARCGADRLCRMMCLVGDVPFEAEGDDGRGEAAAEADAAEAEDAAADDEAAEEDCVDCGRETGFLPAPEHLRAAVNGQTVTLDWAAVGGADEYAVHGLRWGGNSADQSHVWFTEDTTLTLSLDAGATYTFYVVAWDEDDKRRSAPSGPVRVDL